MEGRAHNSIRLFQAFSHFWATHGHASSRQLAVFIWQLEVSHKQEAAGGRWRAKWQGQCAVGY